MKFKCTFQPLKISGEFYIVLKYWKMSWNLKVVYLDDDSNLIFIFKKYANSKQD